MSDDGGPDPFTWGDFLRAAVFVVGGGLITVGGVVVLALFAY